MKSARRVVLMALALMLYPLAHGMAATPAGLHIIQPANGVMLLPGDQINVTVQQDQQLEPFYFDQGVTLLTNGTFNLSPLLRADPYEFTLTVPANATPGDYQLTAIGRRSGAPLVTAPSIHLLIQATGVQKLQTDVDILTLPYSGAVTSLSVNGLTAQTRL